MVEPLQDFESLVDEDDTRPCSLKAFMQKFARDLNSEHAGFMDELRAPISKVLPSAHIAAGTSVYSDLRLGIRELTWVPSGINIMEHLDPFFIRWKLPKGVETLLHDHDHQLADQVDSSLKSDKTSQSWVATWPLKAVPSKEQENKQSGFQLKASHPDVVIVSYMIARAIFRNQAVPFASTADKLLFARTCTRVGADYQIAVAYVPGRAVYYTAFPIDAERNTLVDSGLIGITLVL